MTYEDIKEALEWCEEQLEIRGTTRSNGRTLLCTIKKALEKQIRKPKGHFYEDGGFFKCTKTGKVIRYPLVSFRDLEFCPFCGQAIDWSDEE